MQNSPLFSLEVYEVKREAYELSTDPKRLDFDFLHHFLSEVAYWSPGIARETVEKAAAGSLCFGLYFEQQQIGYTRVISDFSTFAYLADVFVAPQHQGKGIGQWMLSHILAHPRLEGLRRWFLMTEDAHSFYQKLGFQPLPHPEWAMSKT